MTKKNLSLLVVDDSRLMRRVIVDIIKSIPEIENIYECADGLEALDIIKNKKPDVITLDIEMPKLNGLQLLKKLKSLNIKSYIIMLSVLTTAGGKATFEALELGAFDFVPKPSSDTNLSFDEIKTLLIEKIKIIYQIISNPDFKNKIAPATHKLGDALPQKGQPIDLIAIGSSTGGPNALTKILTNLPADLGKPIVITQHMPEGFTKLFANRLNNKCYLKVYEADNGIKIEKNSVYIAKGNYHLAIISKAKDIYLDVHKRFGNVNGHTPSIDVLFNSINDIKSLRTLGIILTGMGKDGAKGLLKLRKNNAFTIGQDRETSIVYGMNMQAQKLGAVQEELPLEKIANKIKQICGE